MHLDEALRQISDIRHQMARSEVFRGYRSATVGLSGGLGLLAAAVQPRWVASPESELGRYLGLWVGVAALSAIVAGAEMSWRARGAGPGLARERTLLAVALNGDPTQAGAAFAAVGLATVQSGGTLDDFTPGIEFFEKFHRIADG